MEMLVTIEKQEKSGLPRPVILFLGVVFLLFPIAHLSIAATPLYLSEAAFLIAVGFLLRERGFRVLFREFCELVREERLFFFSLSLFFFGIVLSTLFNPSELYSLGRLKSFYALPLLLVITLLIGVKTGEEWRWILRNWLWGILAGAFASLVVAAEGLFLYDGRLAGLYQSANYLALLVAPGVLLSAFFIATGRTKTEKASGLLGLLLSLGVLALTRSYAAWFAVLCPILLVSGIIFAKKRNFRNFFLIISVVIVLFSAALFSERGSDKWEQLFSFSERSSLASRVMIWRTAVDMVRDHPFSGIGVARFQSVYLEYQDRYTPYLEWAVPTPHNLTLHFLLEGGLLAFLGWLGVIGGLLFRFWNQWQASRLSGLPGPITLLGAALLAFYLLYGLVDTPYMKNDLVLAVWGSIGLFLAALRARG